MDNEALERRRQAAVVSLAMLMICKEIAKGYDNGKVHNILPEIIVLFAISVCCRRDLHALPINRLVKMTGMPRGSVQRYVNKLVNVGAVVRTDDGVILNAQYAAQQTLTPEFKRIVRKIILAADKLRE